MYRSKRGCTRAWRSVDLPYSSTVLLYSLKTLRDYSARVQNSWTVDYLLPEAGCHALDRWITASTCRSNVTCQRARYCTSLSRATSAVGTQEDKKMNGAAVVRSSVRGHSPMLRDGTTLPVGIPVSAAIHAGAVTPRHAAEPLRLTTSPLLAYLQPFAQHCRLLMTRLLCAFIITQCMACMATDSS